MPQAAVLVMQTAQALQKGRLLHNAARNNTGNENVFPAMVVGEEILFLLLQQGRRTASTALRLAKLLGERQRITRDV